MSEHLEALERLARMRAEGTLSQAEFEAEKQRLLRGGRPRPEEGLVEGGPVVPARRFRAVAWLVAAVIVAAGLFLAWDRFGFGGNAPLAGGRGLVDQALGAPTQWVRSDEIDPMTDQPIISASREFVQGGFSVQASIMCRPASGAVSYTFTTFGEDGSSPAEFRERYAGLDGVSHVAEIRADERSSLSLSDASPRYTNIFEISDPGHLNMADASRLLVKLELKQGEPLFEIDQTNEIVAAVLAPCSETRTAALNAEQARAAQPHERIFAISDDNLHFSSVDRSGIGVETIQHVCIGDSIRVSNDASQPVTLSGSVYQSDDTSQIGKVEPGRSIAYEATAAGEFILTSTDFPNIHIRYRVSDCNN